MRSAHFKTRGMITLALGAMAMAGNAHAAIEFVFDYGTDTANYMTSEKKAILEAAASRIELRINDTLSAIAPSGDFAPNIFTSAPETGVSMSGPTSIGANQIYVYVGSQGLGNETERVITGEVRLATRPPSVPGNDPAFVAYRDSLRSRGQEGYTSNTDYSPWGGSLAFNSALDYYLDADLSTTEAFEGHDFYTVALRGLVAVLGYGTSGNSIPSYQRYVDGEELAFVGDNATAEYGGSVPLAYYFLIDEEGNEYEVFDDRHLDDSVVSSVAGASQTALMTLSINAGERRQVTDLDWAVLSDMGWQVAAVPEPAEYAMLLAGLGVLTVAARCRRG